MRDDGSDGTDNRESSSSSPANMTLAIVPAATAATGSISFMTGGATPAEGTALSVSLMLSDANGVRSSTARYVWSQGDPATTTEMGVTTMSAPSVTDESAWTAIAGADGNSFTPDQAQVGDYIRACFSFTDFVGSMEGPFCAVTGAAVTEVNDAPTSADFSIEVPSHLGSDADFFIRTRDFPWNDEETPTPRSISYVIPTDFPGTIHDVANGFNVEKGATNTALLPEPNLQDTVLRFIPDADMYRLGAVRNFAHFTFSLGDAGNGGTGQHTATIHLTLTPQMPTVGQPQLEAQVRDATAFNEDVLLVARLLRSNHPDALYDPNGLTSTTTSWQQADSASGPWTDIEGTTLHTTFTPVQEHVGKYIRACTIYVDRHPTPETSTHCSAAGGPIVNVDDAPESIRGPAILVNTGHSAANPYILTRANFPYRDDDGDNLTHLLIIGGLGTPANGTLLWGDDAVEAGHEIPVADIDAGMLVYYPAEGASTGAQHNHIQIDVRVDDAQATVSNDRRDIFFQLNEAVQVAATGMTDIATRAGQTAIRTGTLDEDVELVTVDNLTDNNGILAESFVRRWAVADPVTSGGTSGPPDNDSDGWETVGVTAFFTPLQQHVGKYLRYSETFVDGLGNTEGPFYTTALLVANTNDAATGRPTIDADTPDLHRIKEGDSIHIFIGARLATVADEDGLPPWGTTTWRWSLQQTFNAGGSWAEKATGTTDSIGGFNVYTAEAADLGRPIRACVFFDDATGNAEGGDATNETTRVSSATLCSLAEVVHNVNDEPTGTLGAHDRAVAEGDVLALDPTGLMDGDGATRATFRWQWQAAAPESMAAPDADSAAWADIAGATAASFTPDDAQVGQHIRGCVSYTDDQGTAERFCEAYDAAVTNTNDAPVAYDTTVFVPTSASSTSPYPFALADFVYSDEDGDSTVANIKITSVPAAGALIADNTLIEASTVNTEVTTANVIGGGITFNPDSSNAANSFATFKYTVVDALRAESNEATITIDLVVDGSQRAATGAPSLTVQSGALYDEDVPITASARGLLDANGIATASGTWQWQVADAPASGAPQSGAYSPIAGATAATFTPTQAQVGRFVRVCARFTDGDGNAEGPLCSVPTAAIANVDDAPVIADSVVQVPWTADSDEPFRFAPEHFAFSDEDGDELQHITITGLPAQGAFRVGNLQFTDLITSVRVAGGRDLYDINWHPPQSADAAQEDYTRFTWVAFAGGVASNTGTIRIDLIPPGPIEASGAPVIITVLSQATPGGGAIAEGVVLSGSLGTTQDGVVEPNGIDETTLAWQWQQATAPPNAFPTEDDYADIPGADEAEFTPEQAHVNKSIRVCVRFRDQGTPPTDEGPLCSQSYAVTNTNDAPEGAPVLARVAASGTNTGPVGSALDTVAQNAAVMVGMSTGGATLADEDGLPAADGDGRIAFSYSIQRSTAATGGTWLESAYGSAGDGATHRYVVAQADVDAGFLRGCVAYTDAWGTAEGGDFASEAGRLAGTLCSAAIPVTNVNDEPEGRPAIYVGDATAGIGAVGDAVTSAVEGKGDGAHYVPGVTSAGHLVDADGIGTLTYSWQSGNETDGWAEISFATSLAFVLDDVHVRAGFLRLCVFYEDDGGTDEGGDATDAASRASTASLCSIPVPVTNVNDAPVATDNSVIVFTNASATNQRILAAADFSFTDVDGDALASVTIVTLPTAGTLLLDNTAQTTVPANAITLAQLNAGYLGYHPADGATPSTTYATLTFNVTDDGDDGTDDRTSTAAATLTIDLQTPSQIAAEGVPAVGPIVGSIYQEDSQLTASTGTVRDPNGIDADSVAWQWQTAAGADGGAPGDGASWSDVAETSDEDDATFTPLQAQVGQWLRACMTFDDEFTTPRAEGPLCSAPARVDNVNDAPTSADADVHVFTTATAAAPYRFKVADFPFTDEDAGQPSGGSLASITIVAAPTAGGGTFTADGVAVANGTVVQADDLENLVYYPPADTDAQDDYATFTFTVSDGFLSSDPANTITINIAPPEQTAASGQPLITGTPEQGATLAASRGTVSDPNGINTASIEWHWQVSATTSGGFTAIAGASGAEAGQFVPTQAQVGMFLQVCMAFMDNFVNLTTGASEPASERLCSAPTEAIANVNDAPEASDITWQAARDGNSSTITIPASVFMDAHSDPDGAADMLAAVTITDPPPEADGVLHFNGMAVVVTADSGQTIDIEDGEFMGGDLTFTIAESAGSLQETSLDFTLSDGELDSDPATLTITFGKDIEEEQVQQVSAILSVAAVTNATNAIGGAISGAGANIPNAPAFDISMGGTSLMGAAQKLGQSKTADSPHHDWYLGTAPQWEHNAAYNASDNSAESLLNRINAMARGDIALNYSLTDTSNMRFWARYQSLDINGNEGESLEYDGSGTGFYLGADNQITETMRIGLAIGTDSSDITLDLDEDGTDDEATRSATSFYPYLHIDLGNNNNARVIAGFGSGTLDIKSTANSNSTASADLSWNMLAASISHHRPMKGNLSARFDGSLQLGNTSTDETTFTNGSTLMAGKSSASELTINAELRYQKNNITPFASLATRKLGGDLSQSMALDMAFGADLQTSPANLRFAITRQINDTTHQRHSISIDASTTPNALGLTASLGSRYDSITGRPQWQSTIGWQRRNFQTSLQASPGAYRLQARLRW